MPWEVVISSYGVLEFYKLLILGLKFHIVSLPRGFHRGQYVICFPVAFARGLGAVLLRGICFVSSDAVIATTFNSNVCLI